MGLDHLGNLDARMAARIRNLLAVSWAMPPMLFPRSIQVSRSLRALEKRGWQIKVICADPGPVGIMDQSLLELYAGHYETIRVAGENSGRSDDALMSNWLKPALKEVNNQLTIGGYSALMTFAQPWVDHIIGLKVRSHRIPWIAHFSDPWVDSPYYAAFDRNQLGRWRRIEHAVVRRADMVLFTNAQAMELVMKKYPRDWIAKSRVIPHAFDPELQRLVASARKPDDRLHLIYTGDLYAGRSAGGFLKALNVLAQARPLAQELEVQFIGRIAQEERRMAESLHLQGIVGFGDQLPYVESLKKMAQCDVLLLIDAPSALPSPFLPSKLVDYLAFRKPILGLTDSGGASADLLMKLGFSIASPNDVSAIASALVAVLDAWHAGSLKTPPNFEEVVSCYTLPNVGALLDQALQEAIDIHVPSPWWRVPF